jgi:hypothetical protein
MTEQSPSPIGTVAQEAARLIEDMATMARLSYSSGSDPGGDAAEPAQDRATRGGQEQDQQRQDQQPTGSGATDQPLEGPCSHCGAERDAGSGVGQSNCRLCPLCRGVGLLRSVRPETVDLLADLAMSVAAGLREVALWSRASDPASSARQGAGAPADPDRVPVQVIPVDDESEG